MPSGEGSEITIKILPEGYKKHTTATFIIFPNVLFTKINYLKNIR